jgi:hypothetical protein
MNIINKFVLIKTHPGVYFVVGKEDDETYKFFKIDDEYVMDKNIIGYANKSQLYVIDKNIYQKNKIKKENVD